MRYSRTVAVILVLMTLVLSISALASPVCAKEATGKVYTVLGDSIAAGYRLDGYTGDGKITPSAYPALFSGRVGFAKVNDLSKSGSDTADTVSYLKTKKYIDAVTEADVITLSLGSNDLLGLGQKMICKSLGISSLGAAGSVINSDNYASKLTALGTYLNETDQVRDLEAAVAGFEANWTAIIDRLRELNPDAVLIVNNFYNPYAVLDSVGGVTVGKTVQGYLDRMNRFITEHEYAGEKYFVADVTGVYQYTNVTLTGKLDLDPHPNATGHSAIADSVYEVYLAATETSDTSDSATDGRTDTGEIALGESVTGTTEGEIVSNDSMPDSERDQGSGCAACGALPFLLAIMCAAGTALIAVKRL